MYWYVPVHTSTYWYIPAFTLISNSPIPSSHRLAVVCSPDSLLVLQGHQGGSGRQRLPQDQNRQALSAALIRGPRGSWNNAQGRGWHRGRGRRRRSAGPGAAAAAPPRWRCSGCPPSGGEEPAAAPAVAESAQPSQEGWGRGGKKTKG
jgi:hypothetical protein